MISLCTTYDGLDPQLLKGVCNYVDMLEVNPNGISTSQNGVKRIQPDVLRELVSINPYKEIVIHGVGLSIGSYGGWNSDYFDLLDELMDELNIRWHSEHLGFIQVDGHQLNTMLTLPRTREVLDMLSGRIREIQRRYDQPFLVEHIASFLPAYQPEMNDAEFLNRLTSETGCGLILDIYNLECDQANFGFDIDGFLKELDISTVKEVHLAGGVEKDGFLMDVHSRKVSDSIMKWLDSVLQRDHQIEAITYEVLPEAVRAYGKNFVFEQLAELQEYLSHAV